MAELFLAAGRAAWGFAGEEALAAHARAGVHRRRDRGGGGREVVGFVVPAGCEIALLYTHPRAWGSGAGRALLAAGEAALRERGCTEATLWTEERNERPRRFYEAAGWRADGEAHERVWNGAPLRELRYRKRL